MKKHHYTVRQYRLAAGLVLALTAPAIAQVPPLNLPGLPPPPGMANLNTGSTTATAPLPLPVPTAAPVEKSTAEERREAARQGIPINPADMLPPEMLREAGVAPEAPQPETDKAAAPSDAAADDKTPSDTTKAGDADKNETKTADGEPKPDADDAKKTEDTAAVKPAQESKPADTADLPPPPPAPFGTPNTAAVPPLPLPGTGTSAPITMPIGTTQFGPFMPSETETAGLNENGEPLKSWEKPLAPSRTYPTTKFNYRRVMLPASVYRTSYNTQNRHLPIRRTMQDLDKAFLIAVAKNDINGTRALLKSGRNVNQMNAYGDSALIVAVRAGAFDTARLLLARGANPHFYGQGGKTAFHYARQQGNNDFAKLLLKSS